jgi:tetratricopeptide (TPR) repeat protein
MGNVWMSPGTERNDLSDSIALAIDDAVQPLVLARLLERFHQLLTAAGTDDGSILLQEHWAQYYEAMGDFAQAARHREREIELVEELLSIGGPVGSVDEAFLLTEMNRLMDHYLRLRDFAKAAKLHEKVNQLRQKQE